MNAYFCMTRRNTYCSYSLEITYGLKYFEFVLFLKIWSLELHFLSSGLKTERFLLAVSSVTMQGKYIKGNQQLCLGTFCHGDQYPLFGFFFLSFKLLSTAIKNVRVLRYLVDRPNKIICFLF